MAEFVLLVRAAPSSTNSAGRLGERTGRYASWIAALRTRGLLRAGGRVADDAVRVHSARDRDVVEATAPSERVTSYLVVDADDLAGAIALARSCPEFDGGTVTVLPVDPALSP